ncbi:TonB-dependent receptor [Ideonella sp.]|uniref:TonB-dependent receptor n=1 Tax=Ideonella sp. TaxID=1929293 RepID=UPI0035B05D0F
MSRIHCLASALAVACPLALPAAARAQASSIESTLSTDIDTAPAHHAGVVTIVAQQASSLPTRLPTTIEGITGAEVERSINAADSEDALKYLPSLLVRKRYIGDYNHAVLSTRASGTGNSARSLVYADGILLSNLLGNGASFTPRWGLVAPEEIERVDVLYGPFSAAYPGNSVGAVVDFVTRLPQRFEAHAKLAAYSQPFKLYRSDATYGGHAASASLGDRTGDWAWWFSVQRLDNDGQPLGFVTKPPSTTAPAPGAPVLTGAWAGKDKSNADWLILGTSGQVHTVQDHAKAKLAYVFGGDLRAAYTLGWWRNRAESRSASYLRDSDGNAFYALPANSGTPSGSPVDLGGQGYTLGANDFPQSRDALTHVMHGLSLRQRSRGVFDWELAASRYDYAQDRSRSPTVARPGADDGGAGRITDLDGTGWDTLAAKAVWRPNGAHTVDVGLQQERYRWRQTVRNADDWLHGAPTTLFTAFSGETALRSVYGQDTWAVTPDWTAVLGLRAEHWTARDGRKTASDGTLVDFAPRSEDALSPKAALGWQIDDAWALRLSSGRALRMPTVAELFQGGVGPNGAYVDGDPATNPDLRPEESWTTELSALWETGPHQWRATAFHETTRDALYSQTSLVDGKPVASVQNIDRLRTQGLELAYRGQGLWTRALDLAGSLTWTDSVIVANSGYVLTPGDTIGKRQPRVPRVRASLAATWHATEQLAATLAARYGGTQFGTLNNSDTHGTAYQGFSRYASADLRLHWRITRQWSAAFGIDNLTNATYWNFHPYPQRSYSAELRFDL